ncbi:MAG: hypothetical protein AB7M05_06910 [Alphaproteobacteria bacterium]
MASINLDNVKAQLGKNATFVWLIGGAILFLVDGGIANLFSWKAAAFLFIGMFAAAVIVGNVTYFIIRKIGDYLADKYGEPSTPQAQLAMRRWRNVFGLMDFGIATLFLLWVYASFFWDN